MVAYDLVERNLTIAVGLPHAGMLPSPSMRRQLDEMANLISTSTTHALRQGLREQAYPELSEVQFCIALMVTILQRDFGSQYNRAFSEGRYDARDSRNLFLHGPLTGFGGTCCTMPVLYAAIGRRLGYPIKLVLAKQHAFCRWDDGRGDRFNIEATSCGFVCHSDDHYLNWPKRITPEERVVHGFLQNLSPREELAWFISLRGNCLMDNLRTPESIACYRDAARLCPDRPGYTRQLNVAKVTARILDMAQLAPDAREIRVILRTCLQIQNLLRTYLGFTMIAYLLFP